MPNTSNYSWDFSAQRPTKKNNASIYSPWGSIKAATQQTIFCWEAFDFLSVMKNQLVCDCPQYGSDPIFCREEIHGMLDQKSSCRISSASVWQRPIIYRDSFARQPMRSKIESTRKTKTTKG